MDGRVTIANNTELHTWKLLKVDINVLLEQQTKVIM